MAKTKLNEKREKFCQLFTSADREYFGNGVQSYLEVYNIDRSKKNWYKTACVAASDLLSKVKVYERISELLEEGGLNDKYVDKQLLYLISQYSDNSNKLGAIREYNKLKQRIIDKATVTLDVAIIKGFNYIKPNEDNNTNDSAIA